MHAFCGYRVLNCTNEIGPQTKPAPFTPTLSPRCLLAEPVNLNLSPHPTVTSHTAACRHIVPPSLSVSLSSPCTTCAHPTANLSSHQAWPLGFKLWIVLGHDCGAEWQIKALLSRSRRTPQLWLALGCSAAHSNQPSFSRSPILGTLPLPPPPQSQSLARSKPRETGRSVNRHWDWMGISSDKANGWSLYLGIELHGSSPAKRALMQCHLEQ